jgi:hypothetical protein
MVEAVLRLLEVAALSASQDLVEVRVHAVLVLLEVVAQVARDEIKDLQSHRCRHPLTRARVQAVALLELARFETRDQH